MAVCFIRRPNDLKLTYKHFLTLARMLIIYFVLHHARLAYIEMVPHC